LKLPKACTVIRPKKSSRALELDPPGADPLVADFQHEPGVELENLQELHLAVERDPEAVGLHCHARQRARLAGGVELQLARGLDLDDLEHVGLDADIQQQRQARGAVGVDRRAAARRHAERTERDRDVELD
jgi:hypothetical protein